MTDNIVKTIVLHGTNLEKLNLHECARIKSAGLTEMHRLQDFQHSLLLLTLCVKFHKISSHLAKISTLQHLDAEMNDCDVAFFRQIGTFENLRTLIIRTKVTPECFDVIYINRRLRKLELGNAHMLTYADGVKLNLLRELELLIIRGGPHVTDLTSGGDVST